MSTIENYSTRGCQNQGNYKELFKFLTDDWSKVPQQIGCKIKWVGQKKFLGYFLFSYLLPYLLILGQKKN